MLRTLESAGSIDLHVPPSAGRVAKVMAARSAGSLTNALCVSNEPGKHWRERMGNKMWLRVIGREAIGINCKLRLFVGIVVVIGIIRIILLIT